MKEYGDNTLYKLFRKAEEIRGEWNGDEAGEQEDRSNLAEQLQMHISEILDLMKELGL